LKKTSADCLLILPLEEKQEAGEGILMLHLYLYVALDVKGLVAPAIHLPSI